MKISINVERVTGLLEISPEMHQMIRTLFIAFDNQLFCLSITHTYLCTVSKIIRLKQFWLPTWGERVPQGVGMVQYKSCVVTSQFDVYWNQTPVSSDLVRIKSWNLRMPILLKGTPRDSATMPLKSCPTASCRTPLDASRVSSAVWLQCRVTDGQQVKGTTMKLAMIKQNWT